MSSTRKGDALDVSGVVKEEVPASAEQVAESAGADATAYAAGEAVPISETEELLAKADKKEVPDTPEAAIDALQGLGEETVEQKMEGTGELKQELEASIVDPNLVAPPVMDLVSDELPDWAGSPSLVEEVNGEEDEGEATSRKGEEPEVTAATEAAATEEGQKRT